MIPNAANRIVSRCLVLPLALSLTVNPAFAFVQPHSLHFPNSNAGLFATEAVSPAALEWEGPEALAPHDSIEQARHTSAAGQYTNGGDVQNGVWTYESSLKSLADPTASIGALQVRLFPGIFHPESILIPYTRHFELVVNGETLTGDFNWIAGKAYLRFGQRWIRMTREFANPNEFDWGHVPYSSLIQGELLIGNPALQELVGLRPRAVLLESAAQLPTGYENVVEIKNLLENSAYSEAQLRSAQSFMERHNLIQMFQEGRLTSEVMAEYVDALLVLSHPLSGHEDIFVDALDRLHYLAKIDSPMVSSRVKEFSILAQKRKLGFAVMIMDFLAKPEMASRIKTVIDNKGTVWAGGRISERHFFNDTQWIPDVPNADALALRAERLGAHLDDYVSVSDVGFAGNATRVFKNILANKNTVRVVQVADVAVEPLQRWMDEQIDSPWKPEMVKIGEHWYVSLMDLVAPRNPHALLIAGPSSLRDAKHSARDDFETQPLAHPIREESGQFIETETDLAGHGDLIQLMMNSRERVIKALQNHWSFRHVQSDDLGNPNTGHVLAWMMQTGQAVMAATVTPQRVDIIAQVREAEEALHQGRKVLVRFSGGDPMRVDSIHHESGTLVYVDHSGNYVVYSFEEVRREFQARFDDPLEGVKPLLDQASNPANSGREHDLLFEAMKRFQEHVFIPFPKVDLEIEGAEEDVPLLKIDMNEGGNLLEAGGEAIWVEHSQFVADVGSKPGVILTNSRGQSYAFFHDVVMAIFFKHFNTNNFALDPLALAANYDPAIKQIYFDFLNYAHQEPLGRESLGGTFRTLEEIRVARRSAEARAVDIMTHLSDQQWMERSIILDMLMSTLLPPPVDKKGGKIKLNAMAQNKSSFLAHLALTDATAVDFNVLEFDRTLKAMMVEKNNLVKPTVHKRNGEPIQLSASDRLLPDTRAETKSVQIVQVPKTEFTLVKFLKDYNVFVEIANAAFAAEETIGIRPFVPQSFDQIRAIAAIQFIEHAAKNGLVTAAKSFEFVQAMLKIQEGHNSEADSVSLRWFRPAVYEGRWDEIFSWGHPVPPSNPEQFLARGS